MVWQTLALAQHAMARQPAAAQPGRLLAHTRTGWHANGARQPARMHAAHRVRCKEPTIASRCTFAHKMQCTRLPALHASALATRSESMAMQARTRAPMRPHGLPTARHASKRASVARERRDIRARAKSDACLL